MGDLSEDDLRELQNQANGEKMARLLAEVRRHRAAVTTSIDHVHTVVREAVLKVVDTRCWQERKRPYAEPEIVEAVAKHVAERLASPVNVDPVLACPSSAEAGVYRQVRLRSYRGRGGLLALRPGGGGSPRRLARGPAKR